MPGCGVADRLHYDADFSHKVLKSGLPVAAKEQAGTFVSHVGPV